jgi:Uma2 family endonuclease
MVQYARAAALVADVRQNHGEAVMAEPAEKRWTVEEFLAWDDGTDRRHELIGGQIVAMAPPSEAHGTIVANLTIGIGSQLQPPCRVVGEAGVIPTDRDDTYYQADLIVTCSPPDRGRPHPVDPVLIVEVLSPSTAVHDRGRKVEDYSRLPSVEEILLVSSEERRVRYWRRDGRRWIVEDLIGEAELRLATIPEAISLTAIYVGSGV